MTITKGTVVVVVDGTKIAMFRNTGDGGDISLSAMAEPSLDNTGGGGAGGRHHVSSANPGIGQQQEDAYAASVAEYLNHQVLTNKLDSLFVIAAPKTLGELRQHFHKQTSAAIIGTQAKTLTNASIADIEKALASK